MSNDQKRVILLEDEELIRSMIQINFEREGFLVTAYETGEELLQDKHLAQTDIFVLDLMLPGISGQEVTRRLRDLGIQRPILMVTAKDDMEACVTNLDKGVDDYLVKPFDMKELVARVHVLLRRDTNWKCPVFEMDV